MDPKTFVGLSKPHTRPTALRKKVKKHIRNRKAQDAEISALESLLGEWHITEPSHEPSAAERFINIFELRLMLYKEVAISLTDAVRTFSGLLLASKTVYAEAGVELISLRRKYMDAEEIEWSKVYGNDISLSRPRRLCDLNTATVTLSRSLFMAGVQIGLSLAELDFDCRRLQGLQGLSSMPGSPWVLRDLPLDRLEIVIAPDRIRSRTRLHYKGNSSFCRQVGWILKQAEVPRHHIRGNYPKTTGEWRPVSVNPLRARQLVFRWGSENIEYGSEFDGYHVEQCMGSLHGWHLTLLKDADAVIGVEATRDTVKNGGWDD